MREVCNFVGGYILIIIMILLSTGEFFLPQRVCLLDMCISVVCIRSFPCQCLCHWRGILVAGFSNGTIRLYNTETGRKTAEIAAHGRSVTGVDTAQDSGLVSTVYSGTTLIQYIIGTEDVCDVLLSGLTRTVLGETKGVLIKEVSSFHGCS